MATMPQVEIFCISAARRLSNRALSWPWTLRGDTDADGNDDLPGCLGSPQVHVASLGSSGMARLFSLTVPWSLRALTVGLTADDL